MSGTTLGVVIAAIAGVVAAIAVAWPLLGREEETAATAAERRAALEDARAEVEAQLEQALAAIREIEQDHRAGNLSDEDFAVLDRTERARAAELVRRRDELAAQD